MYQDAQSIGFFNSSYAGDTPTPAGMNPFDVASADVPSSGSLPGVPAQIKQTARVAFTAPADQFGISGDADFFGDATAAPQNAASPFRSFYSPVDTNDDVSNEDVTSDDTDTRHKALDRARIGYQMRSREMLRNMQESLDVAESGADL